MNTNIVKLYTMNNNIQFVFHPTILAVWKAYVKVQLCVLCQFLACLAIRQVGYP